MGQLDLNLSTRPFKPYRAVNLLLFLVLLILIGVSVMQVYSYRDYSALAEPIRGEEREVREKSELLSREVVALRKKVTGGSAAAKLTEVEFLNALLVRKSFSWTRLFASLEELTPDEVYLLGLRPFTDDEGRSGINIAIRARSLGDAAGFVRTLEQSGVFGDVTVAVEEKKDPLPAGEVEVTLGAYYFPERGSE
jgi:type IV pilus assembly protein PilN